MAVSQRSLESWLIACTAASLTRRPARLLLCVRTYLAECTAGRKQDCRCWTWRDCATTKIADRAVGMRILPKKKKTNSSPTIHSICPSIFYQRLSCTQGRRGGRSLFRLSWGGKGTPLTSQCVEAARKPCLWRTHSRQLTWLTSVFNQGGGGGGGGGGRGGEGGGRREANRDDLLLGGTDRCLTTGCMVYCSWCPLKKSPRTIVLMIIQPSTARLTFQREMSLLFTQYILTNIDLASVLLCWRFKEPHKGSGPRYSACYVCLTYTATKQDDRCNLNWLDGDSLWTSRHVN